MSISAARVAGLALLSLAVSAAEARITRVEITAHENPTFGGYSWPGVGQYEKLVGIAYGEVDPHDRQNRVIVDIELAPRNSRGNVEYAFNFYILKPIDLSKGAHRVMYEPPNRGGKTWTGLARVSGGGNDPGSIVDPAVLANAFFMPRGYTVVWSGWENNLGPLDGLVATASFPVARHRDGSTITGPSYEYIVTGGASSTLAYPAASLDTSKATLTHRVHLDDVPNTVAAFGSAACTAGVCWRYLSETSIGLVNATTGAAANFVNNDIYEFSYTAKDPTVNGLGFAAVRDWNAWLRYARRDDHGNPNPLAGDIKRIYTEVVSQPGRLLNDFRHLGFNESEGGRKVFDGHVQWIAAGNGLNMNYRFSQTGRTERNRQNHLYIEGRFPFANVYSFDWITRDFDSRYARCQKTDTCPLAMEIYSSNEYWVKAASLLHTDPTGRFDLPDSPYARNYLMSSMQHGTGNPANRGACQQFQNPLSSNATQRALWIAMDEWSTKKRKPPESRVPRLKDRTLVPPLPQAGTGFPSIPGVTYTGLKTTRYLFDYGLHFYDTGIATINPPVIVPIPGATLPSSPVTTYQDNRANGPIYPSYIPKTDSDGNEIAGVRLPDLRVPLATYTGWALRSGVWANDGCEAAGQFIPFAVTEADRVAAGDPRPSVAARYASFEVYHAKVRGALNDLVKERFLLCEDAASEETRMLQAGVTRGVPGAPAMLPAVEILPACEPKKHRDKDDDDDDDD
jgi:hypothetical protein